MCAWLIWATGSVHDIAVAKKNRRIIIVKDCLLANSWKYSTQYVAIKTAQNDFYNCTFSCYNCTIRHQLHTKICPGIKVTTTIALHLTLNISETVRDRGLVRGTTNRKWHMGYRMVTWPMTSSDLERSNSWLQYV